MLSRIMFLSRLPNVFVQIAKCICSNGKMYLFKLQNVFVQITKGICSNYKIYLSKLQNVMEFSCADCAVLPRIMELREAVGKTVFKQSFRNLL